MRQYHPILLRAMAHHVALLMAGAALAGGAGAAELPGLGLYRIDLDANWEFVGSRAATRTRTDGDSGDTTATVTANGRSATRHYTGAGPVTHCIKAITGGAPVPPEALACTDQHTVKTKDGWTHTANCPSLKMRLDIRQLSSDSWEYITQVTMVSTGTGPDMSGMAMVLKQQAQHGATPEERAAAQRQLAALPGMQKESNAQYAAMIAQMKDELSKTTDANERAALQAALARLAPGTPTLNSRSRAVWTRIGNTCGTVK